MADREGESINHGGLAWRRYKAPDYDPLSTSRSVDATLSVPV